MNKLFSDDLKKIFELISDTMSRNKDWLFKLDSAIGDGDLGLTMFNGFNEVNLAVKGTNEKKIGKIFLKAGLVLAEAAPSTIGTLIASGFVKVSKKLLDEDFIDLPNLIKILDTLVYDIMEKGNAKLGEKTIIDTLLPANEALKEALINGKDLPEALEGAFKAAKDGLEATKRMVSKHGRGNWFGDRSVGHEDPGAAAGMLLIKSFYDYIAGNVKSQNCS